MAGTYTCWSCSHDTVNKLVGVVGDDRVVLEDYFAPPLGLVRRRPGYVRGNYHVRKPPQRGIRREWFDLKRVECRASDSSLLERSRERRLVDDATADDVNQDAVAQ